MKNELNATDGVDSGPNAEQTKILWNNCHTPTSTYGSAVQVVCDSHLLHTTACRLHVREPYLGGQTFGVPVACLYSGVIEHRVSAQGIELAYGAFSDCWVRGSGG